MKSKDKKHTIFLEIRIGTVFLITIIMILFVTYYVLSINFHKILTNYSITLVQSMAKQGVQIIEYELESGQKEASLLANSFIIPASSKQTIEFPQLFHSENYIRIIFNSMSFVSWQNDRGSTSPNQRWARSRYLSLVVVHKVLNYST